MTSADRAPRRQRPIRVGLGLTFFRPGLAGIGTYAEGLLKAILQQSASKGKFEWHIIVTAVGLAALRSDSELRDRLADQGVFVHTAEFDPTNKRAYLMDMNFRMPRRVRDLRLDVFHAFDYILPLRRIRGCSMVATVHDLNYRRFPRTFGPVQRWFRRLAVPRVMAVADAVVCISDAMKVEVGQAFPKVAPRLVTIHNGFRPLPKGQRRRGLPEPYAIILGTILPYKNHEAAIRALVFAPQLHLVVVGRDAGPQSVLTSLAHQLGVAQRVHWLGFVDDGQVANLLNRALALMAVSKYEGFGMTVLEGMAAGLPVICSEIPVFREVAGDAAVFVDPEDPQAIADALRAIHQNSDLRERMAAKAKARLQRFTWKNSADQLCRLYASDKLVRN